MKKKKIRVAITPMKTVIRVLDQKAGREPVVAAISVEAKDAR